MCKYEILPKWNYAKMKLCKDRVVQKWNCAKIKLYTDEIMQRWNWAKMKLGTVQGRAGVKVSGKIVQDKEHFANSVSEF